MGASILSKLIRLLAYMLAAVKMPALLPNVDQGDDALLEYSVVYTDRALNHMSANFQTVMKDLSSIMVRCLFSCAIAVQSSHMPLSFVI